MFNALALGIIVGTFYLLYQSSSNHADVERKLDELEAVKDYVSK